jgi:hypothetical protein
MGQYLFQREPLVIIDDKYALNKVFQLRADLLVLGERVLASLYSLQRLPHCTALEGT